MERLEYHKLKNIDNIEVYGSTLCKRYYHIKEIRFLGVKIQSEGFMYKPFFGKKYRASESDLKKLIICKYYNGLQVCSFLTLLAYILLYSLLGKYINFI